MSFLNPADAPPQFPVSRSQHFELGKHEARPGRR
jgi:hypothetical protein